MSTLTAEFPQILRTDEDPTRALQPFLQKLHELLQTGELASFAPFLPLMFRLKDKPYTVQDHFPFEELYRFRKQDRFLLRTGRQLSKSTSLAAKSILLANSIPNFNILFVTPLFEQARRFSTDRVAPFIRESPLKSMMISADTTNSVLHRSFRNNSQIWFSYAYLDADRTRGISSDLLMFDEVQDLNKDFLPIIRETMSHSPWAMELCAGTPKTLDNTIATLWRESSQAEWFIPCSHCTEFGKPTWNIPSIDYHIDRMIGPVRDDISDDRPGVICHKCGQPINPRHGRWVHRMPERRWKYPGLHIPQLILPHHYASPDKWRTLTQKREGWGNTTTATFYNEVLGEDYDIASKLVTLSELQSVSNLGPNSLPHAMQVSHKYRMVVLGVDWGGGGEGGVSFTTVALVGLTGLGQLHVLYGRRLLTPHDHLREAEDIFQVWRDVKPAILAHDYTGAGALRETVLTQRGVPAQRVMPVMYVRSSSQRPCRAVPATDVHPRNHYRVDKSRTLQLTCAMIKLKWLRFFDFDRRSDDNAGLISDFLALVEEKTQTMAAGEMYRIDRIDGMTDDFAQAVNIACVALWHANNAWPNLPEIGKLAYGFKN